MAASIPWPVSDTASMTYGPGDDGDVAGGIVRVELDVRRLDRQLAAVRHGVARVDRQVHEDLLHLHRVGPDVAEVRRRREMEVNVLAQQRA